jgi:hypothetical protein
VQTVLPAFIALTSLATIQRREGDTASGITVPEIICTRAGEAQITRDLRRPSPPIRELRIWGFVIASNEIPANRRVGFDTTVAAMALTAKEMNANTRRRPKAGSQSPSRSARPSSL